MSTPNSTPEYIRQVRDEHLKDPRDFNKLRAFNGAVMFHPDSTTLDKYLELRERFIQEVAP